MTLRLPLILSAFLLTGAVLSSPRPLEGQSARIGTVTVDSFPAGGNLRLGDIPVERLSSIAPRVARLRATPAELRIKLGDTLHLREVIRVLVLDSTGRSLGTLPVMDHRMVGDGGAAHVHGALRVVGATAGEATLRLGFPRRLWTAKERSDSAPHVDVLIRVTKDGPSSPVISPMLRNATEMGSNIGAGYGGCQLDAPPPPSTPPSLAFRLRSELELRRVECSYIEGNQGNGRDRRQWLRAVVLARSDTGARRAEGGPITMQDQQEMIRRSELQMIARMGAQGRGRIIVAGGGDPRDPDLTYEISQGMDTVYLADQAFRVPLRDSALVILVDRHDRKRALTIVGTAMIPAAMPADFWMKSWNNGDTTFMVRPKRDNTYLRDALTAVPAIRAFLP